MRRAQAPMAMFNCRSRGRGLWFFRRQGDNIRRMSGRNRRVERPVASTDDAFHPGKQAAGCPGCAWAASSGCVDAQGGQIGTRCQFEGFGHSDLASRRPVGPSERILRSVRRQNAPRRSVVVAQTFHGQVGGNVLSARPVSRRGLQQRIAVGVGQDRIQFWPQAGPPKRRVLGVH